MLMMTSRGGAHVESLREGLACPACAYSLRGLAGDQVTCPECGLAINIPALVSRQWSRPWWEAPLYNLIAFPLAWAMLALMGLPAAFGLSQGFATNGHLVVLGYIALMTAFWIGALLVVSRIFGSIEGLLLAMLLHLVIPAYIGGLGLAIGGLIWLLEAFVEDRWYVAPWYGVLLAGGVASVAVGRLIERAVAHRCIRRHLRLGAAGAMA